MGSYDSLSRFLIAQLPRLKTFTVGFRTKIEVFWKNVLGAECKFYAVENDAAGGSSAKDPAIVGLFASGTAFALAYLR
jgi:hypothetical protein